MNIYLASSWRNPGYEGALAELRGGGFKVYDFKQPAPGVRGFAWSEVDPAWKDWSPEAFRQGLRHPVAAEAFRRDMQALWWCDACVMLQPCGRSAALEMGFAVGARKPTVIVLAAGQEPELMASMASSMVVGMPECLDVLRALSHLPRESLDAVALAMLRRVTFAPDAPAGPGPEVFR